MLPTTAWKTMQDSSNRKSEVPAGTQGRTGDPAAGRASRLCLLYRSKAIPDEQLAAVLERELQALGHIVFCPREGATELAWIQALEQELRQADLVVPLLSKASVQSEMLAYEVEMADDASHSLAGWPRLLPVRVRFKGPLPDELGNILTPLEFEWDVEKERYRSHQLHWSSPANDRMLVDLLSRLLQQITRERAAILAAPCHPAPQTAWPLEPLGGAVPLDSRFYVTRSTDEDFHNAIHRHDAIVLVKGARQMGKTSLLGRGLQKARDAGFRVVLTDFQKLSAAHFGSLTQFYIALTDWIAHQLEVNTPLPHQWEPTRSPNTTFEDFWRYEVLEKMKRPVLWAMDEFDRLFTTSFGGEVCGLLRAWHNERVLDPGGPLPFLTVAIAYATEAHLFITDFHQSPFNVGTQVTLHDFQPEEVAEMNRRYGSPLRDAAELDRFHQLLAGHPYLVRCGLQELVSRSADLAWLERQAEAEESVFGDHLRRLLVSLSKDSSLTEEVRGLLRGEANLMLESFYRLRSAGVITGGMPAGARLRCELYSKYLKRHLLSA